MNASAASCRRRWRRCGRATACVFASFGIKGAVERGGRVYNTRSRRKHWRKPLYTTVPDN
eukprot:4138905-Pleurochrysis_carterae.AAC.1